jgi:hypothetical protein
MARIQRATVLNKAICLPRVLIQPLGQQHFDPVSRDVWWRHASPVRCYVQYAGHVIVKSVANVVWRSCAAQTPQGSKPSTTRHCDHKQYTAVSMRLIRLCAICRPLPKGNPTVIQPISEMT